MYSYIVGIISSDYSLYMKKFIKRYGLFITAMIYPMYMIYRTIKQAVYEYLQTLP